MKPFCLLAAILGFTHQALASFELALVCDETAGKVDRYDPISRAYLGSFGQGLLQNPGRIVIDQASGQCYIADLGRIIVMNYNTGEFIRSISPGFKPAVLARLSNGNLLASSSRLDNTLRLDTGGAVLQTISTSSQNIEGATQTGDGNLWFVGLGNPSLLYSGSVGSASITNRYSLAGGAPLDFGGLSSYGQQLVTCDSVSGTSHLLVSLTSSGTAVTSEQSIFVTTDVSSYGSSTAIGHGGRVYMAGEKGATSTLWSWLPGTTTVQSMNMTQTFGPSGMALVVAPEPSVYLGLMVGCGWIIRRRRLLR